MNETDDTTTTNKSKKNFDCPEEKSYSKSHKYHIKIEDNPADKSAQVTVGDNTINISCEEKNTTVNDKHIVKEKTSSETKDDNTESKNFSSLVATHYNSTKKDLADRNESRIYHLRNFNNWIKSNLIKDSVVELLEHCGRNLTVLDLCCGKGGDLLKWIKLNVKYMVCADIAEKSLEEFKTRYNDHISFCQRRRNYSSLTCEFIPADCTRIRLREKFKDPSIRFDVVSCQFSFHYCFESLPQAECMLLNVSECLKPGGIFIGTMPDANEIVKRLKQSKSNSFKNDVYAVEMECNEPYGLFGAKYHFYLEGVVNCPEFLVHFPTFEKLALKHGLKLVKRENFPDLFERKRKTHENQILLRKMKALELYSFNKSKSLIGNSVDYIHATVFCQQNNVEQVETISKSEWEVISLYQTFIFQKIKSD